MWFQAAQRREKKKFLNRIDHIKEYIDALEESEERRKALKLYKRSVKEARETAQRSGISIRYKCGRVRLFFMGLTRVALATFPFNYGAFF